MFKRRKKAIFYSFSILLLFIVMLVVSYFISPQPINAMMVGLSDMEKHDAHVYMEPRLPDNTKNIIINDLEQSRERIAEIFGGMESSPTILFVHSSEALKRYANKNRTGQTYYMYWGSYIVIGPKGFSVDVMAHELMHAELRKRIQNKDQVPVWFDEGLATVVDKRYVSTGSSVAVDYRLDELKSRDSFYDPLRLNDNYEIAHHEVIRWYEIVGNSGLNELTVRLNQGESFDELYKQIETNSVKNSE